MHNRKPDENKEQVKIRSIYTVNTHHQRERKRGREGETECLRRNSGNARDNRRPIYGELSARHREKEHEERITDGQR